MDRDLSDASKEEIVQNINSLYDKLTAKMVSLGNVVRSDNAKNTDEIEDVNVIKQDRFALRAALDKIEQADEDEWLKFKEEAQKLVYDMRNRMETEIK